MIEKISINKRKWIPILNFPLKIIYHTKKATQNIQLDKLENILVFFYAGIGDAIMNIPFLQVLKKNAPNAKITLVCAKSEQIILKDQDIVNRFFVINLSRAKNVKTLIDMQKNLKKVLYEINSVHYDVAIEPRGDLRCIYLMSKCNAERKISYNYTGGEALLTDVISPSVQVKHLIYDQLYILESIGCKYEVQDALPFLRISPINSAKTQEFIKSVNAEKKIIIGIHPGASWETKRWYGYPELVKKIGENNNNVFFFVFSTKEEEKAAVKVIESIQNSKLKGIIVEKKLDEYVHIVSKCKLMICNDSGSAHIAAAYNIPTIVIFGPVTPESSRPMGKAPIHIISHQMECKPCYNQVCRLHTNECIKNISVQEVLDIADEIIKSSQNNL